MEQPLVFEYSPKQMQFIDEACHTDIREDHKWNIKCGATRSGKTTLDFRYVIPYCIIARKGLPGVNVIMGVSLGTIERNVLEPMRQYWASLGLPKVIGDRVRADATGNKYIMIFGEKVYLCGMLNKVAISRIRGAEFKYCYCDELAEYNKEAFELLKSRLSLEYSRCDGACNPESDTHWLYEFINSDIDIYLQNYTIFDNPFLSKKFVDELCKEYSGTVYYDRYILGRWKKAEGLVYPQFANNPKDYMLYEVPRLNSIVLGVDFGGNGSYHSFTATGIGFNFNYMVVLESKRIVATNLDPNDLNDEFEEFVNMVKEKYNVNSMECYCDSAEQTLINGLRNRSLRKQLGVVMKNALKREIKDRIKLIVRLLGQKRLFFMFNAQTAINAFSTAVYNSKVGHQDERLDDGTTDIDTVDSTEYTIEPFMQILLTKMEV